jgi:hypothetical protein
MRLASTVLSAVLLLFFCILAHAIEPGDIAAPSMKVPDMNMPKPLITRPNMNVPEPNAALVMQNAINQTGNESSNQPLLTDMEEEVMPTNVSGKWSIRFDDRRDKSLVLNLWSSSKTRIMGYGTLTEKGGMNSVTASGSISAEELTLTIKSGASEYANQKYDEYYLDLFMVNDTMSGTYVQKANGQSSEMGNVTAVRQ